MNKAINQLSWPGLSRPSTCAAFSSRQTEGKWKDVDARDKRGHDAAWRRAVAASVLTIGSTGAAFAHPSVVPHEHPHAVSVLPDVTLLAIAALMVGCAVVVLRKFRKE